MYSTSAMMAQIRETSNSGHPEIGTTSLQRTQLEVPKYFLLTYDIIISVHFEPPKEDNLLTKDKEAVLKCPLFRDSSVVLRDNSTHLKQDGLLYSRQLSQVF